MAEQLKDVFADLLLNLFKKLISKGRKPFRRHLDASKTLLQLH